VADGTCPEQDGNGVFDPAEADEVPGQLVTVRGDVGSQDRDSLLGASGAGQQLGNVRRRVRRAALGVSPGPFDRFVDAVAGGRQRKPDPEGVPLLLATACLQGIEAGRAVLGAARVGDEPAELRERISE
jgi:hypothetical protein